MSTRTIWLDDKAEALEDSTPTPSEIYEQLDFSKGGYAVAPARQAKSEVRANIQRKHAR